MAEDTEEIASELDRLAIALQTPQPISKIPIRPARESDKDAVIEFCRTTWDDQEDYIGSVWDRWLAEDGGAMLVATLDGMPVGIGRGLMLSDREAWLEGIRVDRRYRRQGIFRQLETKLYEHLLQRNARVCRICIASNNAVMTAIARRSGYRAVTAYSIYSAPAIAEPTRFLFLSTHSEREQWSDRRPTPPLYVCRGAKWQTLTPIQLAELVQRNRLWSFRQNGESTGLFVQSEMETPDGSLWVGHCDVWAKDSGAFYRELRCLSDRLGFKQVSGFFPTDAITHKALLNAGYQEVISFQYILYERQLDEPVVKT
ncbi:MAG: N-acetyltransferase family protein [Synechococcus sp.]